MPLLVYSVTAAALLALLHRRVLRISRAAAAFLFLLPFLFVGHALLTNRVYAPVDKIYLDVPLSELRQQYGIGWPYNPATADIVSQMIPWRHVVRESVLRGEWPLWNPYILSGDILAAAAQPAVYSPFTWLALLMPAPLSFTFTAAITFFVAAAATFAFSRDLGCREIAASIAAAGYTCSAASTLYVLWPLGLSWALFPLVLLGTRRIVREPSFRSWMLLLLAFVLVLVSGHPESVLHVVAIGAVYGVFEWVGTIRSARMRWAPIALALTAGVAALLVCAIDLLPYLEALPQSAEYAMRQGWGGGVRAAKSSEVVLALGTDVFPALHLRKWVKPDIGGLAGETASVGSIVLALAVYAVWRVRSRLTWFWAITAVFMLAAHVRWLPVVTVLHKLPLFDISMNERLSFAAAWILALLAGLGVEEILRRNDRRAAAMTLAIVLALLAAGSYWIAESFVIERGPREWGRYTTAAELAGLAVAALAVAWPRASLLLAALLAQRVVTVGNVHRSFPRAAAYPPMQIFEPLRGVHEPFRVTGTNWALLPGTNALYGLEDVRGYEAMTFRPYTQTYRIWSQPQPIFFNRTDDLTRPFLSMLNVRFAFAKAAAPLPEGWKVIAREGETVLLENANVLPRAFVPRAVTVGLQSDVAIDEMSVLRDFRERAWITANVVPYERMNGPGRVTMRDNVVHADMDGDGWVVVSNCAWKGWRVYVDGRRIRPQRANVAFLGIHLAQGRHEVRLVYLPESFVVGRAISAIALMVIACGAIIRARRGRAETSGARARRREYDSAP